MDAELLLLAIGLLWMTYKRERPIATLKERRPEGSPRAPRRRRGHPRVLRLPRPTLAKAQKHRLARAPQQEMGRRAHVVRIFPDDRLLIRLVGMLCLKQNDERLVGAATFPPSRWSRCSRCGST